MKSPSFLSRFSIRTQILIGFVPVMIILAFLGGFSQYKFGQFFERFENLSDTTLEQTLFQDIERDAIELQRSVLVYSYLGYSGILRKIETFENSLDSKFDAARIYAQDDVGIHDRFERLEGHYEGYKAGFDRVVDKRQRLQDIRDTQLSGAHDRIMAYLDDMMAQLGFDDHSEDHHSMVAHLYALQALQQSIYANFQAYDRRPDPALIQKTELLFAEQEGLVALFLKGAQAAEFSNVMRDIEVLSDEYRDAFAELRTVKGMYLHLVNVVLAGKAAEIDQLSHELQVLTVERSDRLRRDILVTSQQSKNEYLFWLTIASVMGVVTAFVIAMGIAGPVRAVQNTLTQLAHGDLSAEIPGLNRRDEVGLMAKAADEFKEMARYIRQQGQEILDSQAQLASIVVHMVDGLMTIGEDGCIESYNQACERIFGYLARDAVGMAFQDVFSEAGYVQYLAQLQTGLDSDDAGFEVEGKRADGSVFPAELSVSEVYVSGRRLLSVILRDITDRKASADKLTAAKDFQDLIINTIPDFVFVKDSDYKIVRANKAFFSNYPLEKRDTIIGSTTLEDYPPKQVEEFLKNDRIALEEGYSEVQEEIDFPDGSRRILFTKKIGFDSGDERYLLGVSRDITEMKKAENAIMQSNEELERFAYIASHDLQEPLRMVSNFTALLEEEYTDQLDEQAQTYMKFIIDASQRMHFLVSDLLDYSRAGHDDTGASEFGSGDKLKMALENLSEAIKETGAQVTITDNMPRVLASPVRFMRLMQNIIGNALKYRKDGVAPEIVVRVQTLDDMWQFSIEDNGIGIKEEYLEQIFVIFKRLHNKDDYSGTGLGLAVCQKIVESFGGEMWVQSSYGQGSVFSFTVPKALDLEKGEES